MQNYDLDFEISCEEKLEDNPINHRIPKLIHELNQPLTVIKAYVSGCIRQLKENNSNNQLVNVMQKVIESTEVLENKVNSMQNLMLQEPSPKNDSN